MLGDRRIRDPDSDPDPQHWFKLFSCFAGAAGRLSRYRRGDELRRSDETGETHGLLGGRLRYSAHWTHSQVAQRESPFSFLRREGGGVAINVQGENYQSAKSYERRLVGTRASKIYHL
jgi:hypothetical protein